MLGGCFRALRDIKEVRTTCNDGLDVVSEEKELTTMAPNFLVCLIGWVVLPFSELVMVGREPD